MKRKIPRVVGHLFFEGFRGLICIPGRPPCPRAEINRAGDWRRRDPRHHQAECDCRIRHSCRTAQFIGRRDWAAHDCGNTREKQVTSEAQGQPPSDTLASSWLPVRSRLEACDAVTAPLDSTGHHLPPSPSMCLFIRVDVVPERVTYRALFVFFFFFFFPHCFRALDLGSS